MSSHFGDHAAAPPHVLAISYPLVGHVTPMLRFSTQLALKGITVSFVCNEDSIPRLTSSGHDDSSPELQIPNFRFVTLHLPCIEVVGSTRKHLMKAALEPIMEKLIRDKNAGALGPTCIIWDMFLPWCLDVAEKLQVPRYVFIPSGVIFARSIQGSLVYFERGQFQISETDGKLVEFDWTVCIPGLPRLRFSELDNVIRRNPSSYRQIAESMRKSDGVLVNSFFELEEKVIESFENWGHLGHDEHIKVTPKIYPIGPLFSMTDLPNSSNVNGLQDPGTNCLRWLDSQPSASVLYVAFGSKVNLSREQTEELAYGLEASNQRFLWVCPLKNSHSESESPSSITEVLPPGFQGRVGDRGLIVTGWAPQLKILAHSSTGGFMTHCGWNSSLESVSFGLPMIVWPQCAEQYLNCTYLVHNLEVAEHLQTGEGNSVKRNEVERAVRRVMVDSEGRAMRSRAEELKRKATAAMGGGGSQSRFLQELVEAISSCSLSPNQLN